MLEDSQIDSKETIILKNQNRIKYQELLSMYENQSRIDIHV